MKIRSLTAALATAALTSTTLLLAPTASAATVTISDLRCRITFTQQDFNDFRTYFSNYDDSVATRLRAAVPGVDADITLVSKEVVNIALNGGDYTPAGLQAWSRYLLAGNESGFTHKELIAMMLLDGSPELAIGLLPTFETTLIDTHVVTRNGAEYMRDELSFDFGVAEEILETGTYDGAVLSERARNVVAPTAQVIADLDEALTEPFQACLDGKQGTFRIGEDTVTPPGNGNGDGGGNGDGDGDGDGGGGGNGGGNGNGNGGGNDSPGSAGSSFGSS